MGDAFYRREPSALVAEADRFEGNGRLFFISQTRSKISDSPRQRALERMMTTVPRFLPQGGGTIVRHYFAHAAEMCDCRYCPFYRGKRKCAADSCPCIEERILAGAASRSEAMTETMKDIHNAAFHGRLNLFIINYAVPDRFFTLLSVRNS